MKSLLHISALFAGGIVLFLLPLTISLDAAPAQWQRKSVNWSARHSQKIKALLYPKDNPPPIFTGQKERKNRPSRQSIIPLRNLSRLPKSTQAPANLYVNAVIDAPPLNGFVPWVVCSVTDARESEEDMIYDAQPTDFVSGRYPNGANSQTDYILAVFDSGASTNVIDYFSADTAGMLGINPELLTSNTTQITGVTGSVDGYVTQPLGLFIDGLGCLSPSYTLTNNSSMVGLTNVSVLVGPPEASALVNAIGSPLSVFFTTAILNNQEKTVFYDEENFNGPNLKFYDINDTNAPYYQNSIPLELRPLGATGVQYIPTLDPFSFDFSPASPSVIIGNSSQSLFFVSSVDLYDRAYYAIDKTRFILDTGAQLTVIGSRIAARLAINPQKPEFEVEITGVTGDTITAPGFYIDTIEIPALGEWLSFHHVPVVLLDVFSPEGGTLDGIIGMNLFVDFNITLKGGGMFLQDDPALYFKANFTADIAPPGGDGHVDTLDLAEFAAHWLQTSTSLGWNSALDFAPPGNPDNIINFRDFAVLAQQWTN